MMEFLKTWEVNSFMLLHLKVYATLYEDNTRLKGRRIQQSHINHSDLAFDVFY